MRWYVWTLWSSVKCFPNMQDVMFMVHTGETFNRCSNRSSDNREPTVDVITIRGNATALSRKTHVVKCPPL